MCSNAIFSSFLLSLFFRFCSLILSHPLCLFYSIFFFPCVLPLLHFLSPLFCTASVLLIAFLSESPKFMPLLDRLQFAQPRMAFLSTTYQVIYESLRPRVSEVNEDMFPRFEELEAYKMVFESYTFDTSDIPAEVEIKVDASHSSDLGRTDKRLIHGVKDVAEAPRVYVSDDQERLINNSGEIKTKTDTKRLPSEKMEYEVKAQGVESDKVEGKCQSSAETGSRAKGNRVNGLEGNEEETASKAGEDNGQEKQSNLASCGLMRREKEWRRTLACKLLEERQDVNRSEGMDLLWETYEKQSNKIQSKSNRNKVDDTGKEEEEGEEEEEESRDMCCLQALKFSGGKTNVMIGRTNLVKISKALKGIGWFQQVTKHAKIKGPRWR